MRFRLGHSRRTPSARAGAGTRHNATKTANASGVLMVCGLEQRGDFPSFFFVAWSVGPDGKSLARNAHVALKFAHAGCAAFADRDVSLLTGLVAELARVPRAARSAEFWRIPLRGVVEL